MKHWIRLTLVFFCSSFGGPGCDSTLPAEPKTDYYPLALQWNHSSTAFYALVMRIVEQKADFLILKYDQFNQKLAEYSNFPVDLLQDIGEEIRFFVLDDDSTYVVRQGYSSACYDLRTGKQLGERVATIALSKAPYANRFLAANEGSCTFYEATRAGLRKVNEVRLSPFYYRDGFFAPVCLSDGRFLYVGPDSTEFYFFTVMDSLGNPLRKIHYPGYEDRRISFIPSSGDRILFMVGYTLCSIDTRSGKQDTLYQNGIDNPVAITPDARHIIYGTSERYGTYEKYLMVEDLSNRSKQPLGYSNYSYLAISPNSKQMVLANHSDHIENLFVIVPLPQY
jgi:hypothetical protein